MPKIAMYYHGGSANHGCEAIVRSTVNILGGRPSLYSAETDEDKRYGVDTIIPVYEDRPMRIKPGSLTQMRAALSHKLRNDDFLFTYKMHQAFFDDVQRKDIYLSIGGDNYCYKGQDILEYYNRGIHKKGAKTVLWGCSINPDELTSRIRKDLSQYDLITARDSISYEILKTINDNTFLIPDPAFCLETENVPLPEIYSQEGMVGINLSPLIMKYGDETNIHNSFRNLMNHILKTTKFGIVLVPHVVKKNNDDRITLQKLKDEFGKNDRIIMLPDDNCMRLKNAIGKCRFFVGTRTHATIAAYSQGIPTLVVGYSTKSLGIARDLFGSEEHYVISASEINIGKEMVRHFEWLQANEQMIKKCLLQKTALYDQKFREAANLIHNM